MTAAPAGRRRLGEHLQPLRPDQPVRRLQGVGLRPRGRPARPRALPRVRRGDRDPARTSPRTRTALTRIDRATWSHALEPVAAARPGLDVLRNDRVQPEDVLVAVVDGRGRRLRAARPRDAARRERPRADDQRDRRRRRASRQRGRAGACSTRPSPRRAARGAPRLTLRVLGPNEGARRPLRVGRFVVEGMLRGEFFLDGDLRRRRPDGARLPILSPSDGPPSRQEDLQAVHRRRVPALRVGAHLRGGGAERRAGVAQGRARRRRRGARRAGEVGGGDGLQPRAGAVPGRRDDGGARRPSSPSSAAARRRSSARSIAGSGTPGSPTSCRRCSAGRTPSPARTSTSRFPSRPASSRSSRPRSRRSLGLVSRIAPALVGGNAVVALASETHPARGGRARRGDRDERRPGRRRQHPHRAAAPSSRPGSPRTWT